VKGRKIMDGKLVSVSCELESAVCSTETAAGETKRTLVKGLGRAWVRTRRSLGRVLQSFTETMEVWLRVCGTLPAACRYPL
jgi:hypothetical protein